MHRDVLLACKSQQPPTLPPPSPVVSLSHLSQPSALTSFPFPKTKPDGEFSDFKARIASIEARTSASSAPPVQKVGDTWVAASALGTSDVEMDRRQSEDALRSSVQRMFEVGPDADLAREEVVRRDSVATERILAWQPATERELSIFSRASLKRSNAAEGLTTGSPYAEASRAIPKSETVLSFDPNDLNPSRSASQVRRPSMATGLCEAKPFNPREPMSVVLEGESDDGGVDGRIMEQTQLSHVTFPKPKVGGLPMTIPGGLPMLASVTSSSVDTGTAPRTPHTEHSSMTTVSSVDPTVLAKLETHSTEYGTMARQIDGVQLDLHRIISSLGALVQQANTVPEAFPKVLDEKISSLQLDVKGVENALHLSALASNRQTPPEEPKLVEVQSKLDNIAKLCEGLLAGQVIRSAPRQIDAAPIQAAKIAETPKTPAPAASALEVKPNEEVAAGEEVAQIMADLVCATFCEQ